MGNLRSVWKAFHYLGEEARITRNPKELEDARKIVLPGVGAFRDCMANLLRMGLADTIVKCISSGKPYLGICLGLQILFDESEEYGRTEGLGIVRGKVVRFPPNMPSHGTGPRPYLTVPHIGWNSVRIVRPVPHLESIPDGSYFYFVHSYYGVPEDPSVVATTTEYGIEFPSSIWMENVFACQFHPEKSQLLGLKVIKNFIRME